MGFSIPNKHFKWILCTGYVLYLTRTKIQTDNNNLLIKTNKEYILLYKHRSKGYESVCRVANIDTLFFIVPHQKNKEKQNNNISKKLKYKITLFHLKSHT